MGVQTTTDNQPGVADKGAPGLIEAALHGDIPYLCHRIVDTIRKGTDRSTLGHGDERLEIPTFKNNSINPLLTTAIPMSGAWGRLREVVQPLDASHLSLADEDFASASLTSAVSEPSLRYQLWFHREDEVGNAGCISLSEKEATLFVSAALRRTTASSAAISIQELHDFVAFAKDTENVVSNETFNI